MLNMANTASADSVMIEIIFHEESKAGWGQAVSETGRVFVNISSSFAVQLTEGSSSRDPTLRVVLQNEFLRLALTSCWSEGRLSSRLEMVSQDSGADYCREDG